MNFFLLLSFLIIVGSSSLQAQKDSILVTIQGDTVRSEPGEYFNIFTKATIEPSFRGGAAEPGFDSGSRSLNAYKKQPIIFRLGAE